MLGVRLFTHTWNLIFRNLGDAFKVSVAPTLLMIGVYALFFVVLFRGAASITSVSGQVLGGGFWLLLFCVLVFELFMMSIIAVAWHRFVLLNERPSGYIPAQPFYRLKKYVWRLIMLVLALMLIIIPIYFVIAAIVGVVVVGTGSAVIFTVLAGAIIVLLSYISMRFSLVLPANALGKDIGIWESWAATKKIAGPLFMTVFIIVVVNFALVYVSEIIPVLAISLIANIIVQWITMMLSIGILTTLYGHCVEGRDLPA